MEVVVVGGYGGWKVRVEPGGGGDASRERRSACRHNGRHTRRSKASTLKNPIV